jgi:hypothetical protein
MGPRLVSRGNACKPLKATAQSPSLQWGRGLLAAEITESIEQASAILLGFNGAAAC